MNVVICSQVVLSRAPEGPLAAHICTFAKSLVALGYGASSAHRQVLLASCFSRWLGHAGVAVQSVTMNDAQRYLRCRARRLRPGRGDLAALTHFIDFLRREGVVPAKKIAVQPLTTVGHCAEAYERYLREARALARATIVNYVPFIRAFLSHRFGDAPVVLSQLCPGDVVRFVQWQAPRMHRRSAKLMTSALRSFLSYAQYCGEVAVDLTGAVPIVPNWSMTSIPRAIAPDQVRQLLASMDRRTAMGRRDYAILLLLARLGLRSGEVASLKLDDIDWNAGQLTVCGKSGHRSGLPLPADVGKAIAAYLQQGRPHCTSRCLFLRAKAPVRGFHGAGGIGSMVRHALQRAGIDAPTTGTHQFRHGLATEMLRKGASLGEIGDVLGHRHLQTTKIYTKVDIAALRTLALPWSGGAQ